jgi:hypothetical protein
MPPYSGHDAAICVREGAGSINMTVLELAHMAGEVAVDLSTPSMLQIILPFANVIDKIIVLQAANVLAFAASFARDKVANVDATRSVFVSSIAVQLTMMKFSLLHIAVSKLSATRAVFLVAAADDAAGVNASTTPEETHLHSRR